MSIEQAKERLKSIVDFYKLDDENNYDYSDDVLISMKLVLEEIERLEKRNKEIYEGFMATTEELCEATKEIERLKTLWEADRQNWACIMYEKEKEIDKLKNNKPDLTNFIKLETAKLNRKREQEKNRLYSENLLLKNDVERLHSIIKEVREYIKSHREAVDERGEHIIYFLTDDFDEENILEILDKENI